jgi:hypothetical protein
MPCDEFWQNRIETNAERPIQPPLRMDDVAAAESLMRQLGIRGELNKIEQNAADDLFKFDVSRPGESFKVEANFGSRRAAITRTEMNGWGVFRNLHTFTGSKYNEPERKRDWVITSLWVVAMFASAMGLIAMVLTSLYLWWRLSSKRTLGAVVLGAGMLYTGYFIWGLRLLF